MRKFKRYLSLILAIAMAVSVVPFQASAAADLSISVDWNDDKGNNMEGIGGSYAFNKSHSLMQVAEFDPDTAAHLVELIYSPENGTGQSIVRSIIGDGGVRSVGSAARPGFNPINGLRADGSKPGFDVEGNAIPMSTRIYNNSTAARNDNGQSSNPGSGVTLADPENPGFATNGTALYGAYGYTLNDWGNRHYDGASDTIWPNEGKYDADGDLVSGYGFVWDLPQWNQAVPGDTGGFTNNFVGNGEVEIVDRPRTMKELFDVDQVWIMNQAQAYGVDTFYVCAWTPPYWMKTSMSIFGQDQGSADYLRAEVDENGKKIYYQAYADYMAAYVYGYWTQFGIPVTHVGPYNESESTHGYSGFRSRNADEVATLVNDYILPTFAEKFGEDGLYADAKSPDGEPLNWMPEIVVGDGTNLGASFQNSSFTGPYFKNADNYGKVTASTHFYGSASNNVNARTMSGSPGATPLMAGAANYPADLRNYSIWQTEYMNQDGNSHSGVYTQKNYNQSIDDAVRWAYLMSNCFNSDPGFNGYMFWWSLGHNGSNGSDLIRLQSTGSPQAAGGSTVTGAYHVFKRFYSFGHFSRFSKTGDIHIGSTTQLSSYLNSLAYKRPDGSDFSITLTNADYEAKNVEVTLQNFDGYKGDLDSVTMFRTSDSENMKKFEDISVSGNKIVVEMPPQSVITLVPSDGEYAGYNGLDTEGDLYSSYESTESDDVIGDPEASDGVNGFPSMTMKNGDALVYKNINFADGSANGGIVRRHLLYMLANIESAPAGGIIRAYVAEPGTEITDPATEATYVGEIIVPKGTASPKLANTTNRQVTGTRSTRIDTGDLGAYMNKDLYLVASGVDGSDLFSVSRFRFDADDNGVTSGTPTGGNVTSPARPATVGVLANGDFETTSSGANTASWTAVGATFSAVNTQTYSGLTSAINNANAYSAQLTNRGANSGISQNVNLTAGERYTFRGMFMPTVDGANAGADLVYKNASGEEIGREVIAYREDIGLLPERESGVRPKLAGTAAGSFGDLNIPIAGIPMNTTAANPTKFRPSGWYEVIGTFTYNPPTDTASVALVLGDDTTATMYIDEVTLVAAPDRDKLLSIMNSLGGTAALEAVKAQAQAIFTNADLTQAQVNAIASAFGEETVQIKVSSDKNPIMGKETYFNVAAGFTKITDSNAVRVTYKYDAEKFDYHGFTAAEGVSVLATDAGEGEVTITIANLANYATMDFGSVLFATKAGIEVVNGYNKFEVSAEFVLKNDSAKVISTAANSTIVKTIAEPGPAPDGIVDLIYLSNVIDLFGVMEGDERWSEAEFFDYNGNGEIDITDIAYVAQRLQ